MLCYLTSIRFSAVALVCFWAGNFLSAQVLNEADLLIQPTELLNVNTSGTGSEAYIQQVGQHNELELFQQQAGLEGNLVRALQSGEWNVAIITQTEHGNKLALIQKGSANYFELASNGFENELVNIQDGNNNRIVQQFFNSSQISSEFVQVGNSNEITQVLENIQDQSFIVRQIGDGLKVIIRQVGN